MGVRMKIEKLLFKLSLFLPENIIASFKQLMVQGGFTISAREYAGYALLLSIVAAVASFQVASLLISSHYALLIALFTFTVLMTLFYLIILTTADARARRIEEVLPDALQMMSANIRAGMTIENAIWAAAKPEFGPLEEEIRVVSGKVFGGKPVTDALNEMATRVRSRRLERAVKLLNEGIQLGGEMAPLLEEVARDLKVNSMLAREIASATTMYMIFIVFTAVIASPVMFAASVYYADMSDFISSQRGTQLPSGEISVPTSGLTGIMLVGASKKTESVSPQEVMQFAIACIILTTFFGALTLAEIRYGRITRGLKYIPIFMIVALLIFFSTYALLRNVFGFLFM